LASSTLDALRLPSELELANGIPVFLDQLGKALRLVTSSDVVNHDEIQ